MRGGGGLEREIVREERDKMGNRASKRGGGGGGRDE